MILHNLGARRSKAPPRIKRVPKATTGQSVAPQRMKETEPARAIGKTTTQLVEAEAISRNEASRNKDGGAGSWQSASLDTTGNQAGWRWVKKRVRGMS
jgi:hypothetical protein